MILDDPPRPNDDPALRPEISPCQPAGFINYRLIGSSGSVSFLRFVNIIDVDLSGNRTSESEEITYRVQRREKGISSFGDGGV